MKKIEASFIQNGRVGVGKIEQTILDNSITESEMSPNTGAMIVSESGSMQNTSRYLNYNSTDISSLTGDIILFFHADRCPLCQQAESNFLASGVPM